jgi:GT2 family glycosyltransferase
MWSCKLKKACFLIKKVVYLNNENWFLENWTNLIKTIPNHIEWKLFNVSDANVYLVRDFLLEKAMEYNPDYYMWIDSDTNFSSADFWKLFEFDKHIISGLYSNWPIDDTGEVFFQCWNINGKNLTNKDIENKNLPIEVASNGMGWMLVKKEVFEKVEFPFHPLKIDFIQGETGIFAQRIKKSGFKIYIHPEVVVGHEKYTIIKREQVSRNLSSHFWKDFLK